MDLFQRLVIGPLNEYLSQINMLLLQTTQNNSLHFFFCVCICFPPLKKCIQKQKILLVLSNQLQKTKVKCLQEKVHPQPSKV